MLRTRGQSGDGDSLVLNGNSLFPGDGGRSGALLTGPHSLFMQAYRWQAHLHVAGLQSRNIDCAMRFNPFVLVDESIRLGLPPEEALLHITIQRAFTPYQILDALHAVAQSPPGEGERAIYFLMAPAKQFFDGDVSQPEAEYLLRRMVEVLSQIRRQGTPMVILEQPAYHSKLFSPFLESIRPLHGFNREVFAGEDGVLRGVVPAIAAPNSSLFRTAKSGKNLHGKNGSGKNFKEEKMYGANATSIFHADRAGGVPSQVVSTRPAKRGAAGL